MYFGKMKSVLYQNYYHEIRSTIMWRSFENHILPLLDSSRPTNILEIGVLYGHNTLKLLDWCSKNDSRLTSIDPIAWTGDIPEHLHAPMNGYIYKRGNDELEKPTIKPTGIEEAFSKGLDKYWTCFKQRSLDFLALPDFSGYDFYLIDGDHNYYTVMKELSYIHRISKSGDILLFNDVSGVWAKNDLYYDPSLIPTEHMNTNKQGVLIAINDFLDQISEKKFWRRINCPYEFKILTRKNDGIGLLKRRPDRR